jgi:glycosyl transferase family 1
VQFDSPKTCHIVSLWNLPHLARRLADPSLDLIVVHTPANVPWSFRGLSRALFRRSVLGGNFPFFRMFAQQMVRRHVAAPIAVVDTDDPSVILRHNVPLLDRAMLYFKRELPPDHWRVFAGTLHPRLPTPRFRLLLQNRRRIEKLRPISLGVPVDTLRRYKALPTLGSEKHVDVFFSGMVRGSSTVRERGIEEIKALEAKGIVIDIPDHPLPLDEYLKRCARSWLAWSPEGLGWDCFRPYEAALCRAVPVISRPTVERYKPLICGIHALYHDTEPGDLSRVIEVALKDRDRLLAMATKAHAHVLTYHTPAAVARYVVETTLAHAKVPTVGDHDRARGVTRAQ